MTGKVIQGSFLGSEPKLAWVQPRVAAPAVQSQPAARPPAVAFGARSPGPPMPAFAARPPAPVFAGRSGAVQRHGAGGAFAVEAGPLGLASGGGRPLPDAVRGKMESALGASFADVRVHVGPQAERIGAIAFTVGSDIYFAPGRFQPDTVHGQQLLGHELAHVVQQRAGRVKNPLGSGLAVVQDHALEAEADRLGQRAAILTARPVPLPSGNPSSIVLQNQNWHQNSVAKEIRHIENRKHTNIGISQAKYRQVQRMHTIQRRPIHTAQITGVTHLREVQYRSLVRGSDYAEVKFPETVTIDMGDRWKSHLGINLSQTRSPENLWYRVLSYRGNSIGDREIYIREEMIKDLGPSPNEIEKFEHSASIKGQIWNEVGALDLNCGRYCAASAIKFWFPELGDDVLEVLLGIPTKKNVFDASLGEGSKLGRIINWKSRIGWEPGEEGKFFFEIINTPTTLEEWRQALEKHGPLIASGDLANVLNLGYVSHNVLVTGITTNGKGGEIVVQDSFSTKSSGARILWSFNKFQKRVVSVYRVQKLHVELSVEKITGSIPKRRT